MLCSAKVGVGGIALVVVATVGGASGTVPPWAGEALLIPFIGWLALTVVNHGQAIKGLPKREELDAWRRDSTEEHRRLFTRLEEIGLKVAENVTRLEGLTLRVDAHRGELDAVSATARKLGSDLNDVRLELTDLMTTKFIDLDDRLTTEHRRLEDRVDRMQHFFDMRRESK